MRNWIGLLLIIALFTGYAISQEGGADPAEMMKKMKA